MKKKNNYSNYIIIAIIIAVAGMMFTGTGEEVSERFRKGQCLKLESYEKEYNDFYYSDYEKQMCLK